MAERRSQASRARLLCAALLGAALGLGWWALYDPPCHPLGLLLGGHVLAALGVERLLALAGGRWRRPGALLGALGLGFAVAPAWLRPLHATGMLGGKAGAAADAGTIALCLLLGAALGAAGRLGAFGLVGAAALFFASGRAVDARLRDRAPPAALAVTDHFPEGPVAVIGIDGGDWRVAEPLIERGELPQLAALRAAGRAGVLRSSSPSYSPVVWTTIFSGQPPSVHGIRGWYTSDARNRRVPLLWEIFGAHGRSSLVLNVPGTWPPHEVTGGTLLAGFPIPGLVTGARGQMLGLVISSRDEPAGAVETLRATPAGDGRFRLDLPLASLDAQPRFAGVGHAVLDTAVKKKLVRLAAHRVTLTALVRDDGVLLEGPALEAPVLIPNGRWSPWLPLEDGDTSVVMRAHRLEAEPSELRLYLTPPFQAPWDPRFPFASGELPSDFFAAGDPYFVEGVGWHAARDARVAQLLPPLLTEVEEARAAAAERLLGRVRPDLFVYVVTLTDRIQHPFWGLHDPSQGVSPPPGLAGQDPVEAAYRAADGLIGRLLALLPRDATVWVVSDHGAAPAPKGGEGDHRPEGLWIARGPAIAASPEPLELALADVVPSLLHCLGAPLALDLAGRAVEELCPDVRAAAPVASYAAPSGGEAPRAPSRIDASQEEQLRALGYVE